MNVTPVGASYRRETPPAPLGTDPSLPRPPGRWARVTRAGFLACAAVAIGCGVWALCGSGTSLVTPDAAPHARASPALGTPGP